MNFLLRRSERTSAFGKLIFVLDVRAELSDEELSWIDKYKFGSTLLYARKQLPQVDRGTVAGLSSILLHHALNVTISVNDLRNGKSIECKDILEMLAAEEQIKEAAQTFASILRAASQFGGEEVLAL